MFAVRLYPSRASHGYCPSFALVPPIIRSASADPHLSSSFISMLAATDNKTDEIRLKRVTEVGDVCKYFIVLTTTNDTHVDDNKK